MGKNNLNKMALLDEKRHYKMYKSKKGWLVSGITTAAMTGMVLATTYTANADSVNNVTPTEATTTDISDITDKKGSTENKDGYNVSVDHSALDNAVDQAKDAGVQITQGQTTTETVSSKDVNNAVTSIASDYAKQTSDVVQATENQIAKNNSFEQDTKDADQTNASNQNKIDSAVEELTNAGGVVSHDPSKDTTTDATIDNYQNKKQEVNQSTDNTVKQIKDATEQLNARNKVEQVANDTSELDKAVENAKTTLGADKVSQEESINRGNVTPSNADSIANDIRNDYSQQSLSINNTVQKYQDAVNAAGSINRKELDDAVNNAKAVLGDDSVKQEATVDKNTSVDNVSSTVDEVNRDYQEQTNNINKVVSDYQKEYADYEKKMEEYRSKLNSNQISSNDIIQRLTLGNEPDAVLTVDGVSDKVDLFKDLSTDDANRLSGMNHAGYTPYNVGVEAKQSDTNLDGDILKVTYSNLQNSYYGDRKIAKIVATYKNAKNNTTPSGVNGSQKTTLLIWSNPVNGFWYQNATSVQVSYEYYDENNNRISFENNADGGGAWVTVGSLNSGDNRTEGVKLLSNGRAYGFLNSTVEAHDKWLYSDYANDNQESTVISASGKGLSPLINSENERWDGTLSTPLAYIGAGVFNVTGDVLELEYTTERSDSTKNDGNVTWATISTTIVKDDSGITKPETPNINYYLNSVTVEKPSVSYHYNKVTPLPSGNTISYGYNKLNVAKPDAEQATFNYKELNVLHDDSNKSTWNVVNNKDNNIENKNIAAGDIFTYTISPDDLKASSNGVKATREKIDSYTIVDSLPKGVDLIKWDVANGNDGGDITNSWNYIFDKDKNQIVLTAKKELLDLMVADLTSDYKAPKLHLTVKAIQSGSKIDNTALTYINGIETKTNTVTNNITKSEPNKSVEVNGKNADNKSTIANDVQNYTVNVDYKDFTNIDLSDPISNNELSFTDNMVITNKAAELIDDSLKLYDASGKEIESSLYTKNVAKTDNGYTIKYTFTDPREAIKAFGGKVLQLKYSIKSTDGATGTITNSIVQNNLGVEYNGNKTVVNVVDINPKKDVVGSIGSTKSLDGQKVAIGSDIYYKVISSMLPENRVSNIDSWSFTDPLDEKVEYNNEWEVLANQDLFDNDGNKLISANGSIKQYFTLSKDGNTFTITANDEYKKLINSDKNISSEQGYTVYLGATVKTSGWAYNTADEVVNGDKDKTNTVKTNTPDPTPAKKDYDTDGNDINGKNVLPGSTNRYELTWGLNQYKDINANSKAIQKGFYFIDDIPDNAFTDIDLRKVTIKDSEGNNVKDVSVSKYSSFEEAPKDVQETLKANNIAPEGTFIIWKATDPQQFFTNYVQKGTDLKLTFDATVNKAFSGEYRNKAYEIDFGKAYQTNEVTNKIIKSEPKKVVSNANGEDINDKNVARGDVLNYDITWDLSDFTNYSVTKEQLAKKLSVFDDYDESKLKVTDTNKQAFVVKDGNDIVSSDLYDVTWDEGAWTITAKDPSEFLKTYGGKKLNIMFFATVSSNAEGDIYNKAIQNNFGQEIETNTVVNHIPKIDPKKDIIISVDGDETSKDGQTIDLGEVFDYKLETTDRPENYGGITEEWSFTDQFDLVHDQYLGQTVVKAKYDFVLKDGTMIKAGDDITKYFEVQYDADTGNYKVSANQEYLDIINLPENKKTKQGWIAYVQMKRIGSGEVTNTAYESYNNEIIRTNTVVSKTPEPEKPKVPETPEAPEAPNIPQPETPNTPQTDTPSPQPVKNIVEHPQVAKQEIQKDPELPQMGDEEDPVLAALGIALGAIGTLTYAGTRKKRQN